MDSAYLWHDFTCARVRSFLWDGMRLPGTRYQEHGWEQVRKLLGYCSLAALRQADLRLMGQADAHGALLDAYTDAVADGVRRALRTGRGEAAGNSYGDSVGELALSLLFELQAQPAYWHAFAAAVAADHARAGAFWLEAGGDAMLRKKVNDMYAGLRDKVDADNYQAALGRACSPNKIYTYRMLDTAYRAIEQLFANWRQHAQQVAAILGRAADGIPIEARQMQSIAGCKAEWVIRWSATLELFTGSPGPLHTRSKRFSSLKNNPEKIAAMLAEIGDYEALSANLDAGDGWRSDEDEAALWLADYWRVLGQSEQREQGADEGEGGAEAAEAADDAEADLVDLILQAPPDDDDEDDALLDLAAPEDDADAMDESDAADDPLPPEPAMLPVPAYDVAFLAASDAAADAALAASLSLPPRFIRMAQAAQNTDSWVLRMLAAESLPIRLAVYHKMLGPQDDSYPDAWLDPASGELPTLQQLAALDRISMPTLRKRRNAAIDRLNGANAGTAQ